MRACLIVVAALLLLAAASCQTAAPPACAGDTPADRAVCGNTSLRNLQVELGRQMSRSRREGRLMADHTDWNNHRDALCPILDTMCLSTAYEERIALATAWGDKAGSNTGSIGTAPLSLTSYRIDGERVACAKVANSDVFGRCTLVAYFDLTISLVKPFTAIAHCDLAYEYETADHARHQRNERHRIGIFGFGERQRSPQFVAFGPGQSIHEPVIGVTFKALTCGFNSIV